MNNYKWDVVFACSGNYVNNQLKVNADKYIQEFLYEDSDIRLDGSFGPWEIAPGGSSSLLNFHTPIEKGNLLIKSTGHEHALDGIIPLMQLQLSFINGANGVQEARFNCIVIGKGENDTTPGAVTMLNPDTTGTLAKTDPSGLSAAFLTTALPQCLIQNRDKLNFVFASILTVPPQGSCWLTIKKMTYAYQEHMSGQVGHLSILGMMTDVDISAQAPVFDTSLLRPNDDYGFILSGDQFLINILMPSLPTAYIGSSPSEFKFTDHSIVNNGNVHLDKVRVGAIDYYPYINNLNIYIDNSNLRSVVSGKCDITGLADAYVTFSVISNNASQFIPSDVSIKFLDDPNKTVTQDKHIPWWEEVLGALTLGIMNLIIEIVSDCIEDSVANAVSKTGLNAQSMGALMVQWPGQENTVFTDGGLLDNFYMRGNFR